MPLDASDFAPSGAPTGDASTTGDALTPAGAGLAEEATGARAAGEGVDALSGSPDEPYGVSLEVKPSGMPVYYQAGPKRLYRAGLHTMGPNDEAMREADDILIASAQSNPDAWVEVPSVTTVNGVIDKSGALIWWGQGVGGLGALRLLWDHGVDLGLVWSTFKAGGFDDARRALCDLLVQHKISTNEVRDQASDRGVNVHAAFEQWAADQRITPQPVVFAEHEQGYVQGLKDFLEALTLGEPTEIEAEVMVASLKRRFAGRYDLRLRLNKPCQVVTRTYPVRKDKVEEIPAGTYLLDLKTSKDVYDTHYLQLEAYEGASVECGYEPTDYRGVIHVTAGGKYELHVNQLKNTKQPWSYDDFLVARELYRVMEEVKRR